MESLLLPACYLAPIAYFAHAHHAKGALSIDASEHFVKQTYRSRAEIGTANGKLDLIVPIAHQKKGHVPMRDVRISDEFAWQRLHWMSLQTAYRRSAYFEYYEDDFAVFYEKKWNFLFDLNWELTELLCKRFKMQVNLQQIDTFQAVPSSEEDLRQQMSPKSPLDLQVFPPYTQVFEEITGFLPNLSAVDLLFNQGPMSKAYFPKLY
jgi:hypothetical protein